MAAQFAAVALLLAHFARSDEAPPPPAAPCPAATIPNAMGGCAAGPQGKACPYECEPGYIPIGRHVCQSYTTTEGSSPIVNTFFGGRCARLCANKDCAFATSVRWNSTDAHGQCLATRCMDPQGALHQLARGAYSVWNLGRSPVTGIYVGKVDPSADASSQGDRAHIGINGVALIMECVAAEMGWISRAEAQARVTLSLTALAGELPGFTLARQEKHGWIPTFFNASTGAEIGRGGPHTGGKGYTTLDSGLNAQGVLFARTYFTSTASKDGGSASATKATAEIARLAKKVFNLVRFEHLLCDPESSQQDDQGTAPPFTFDDAGGCGALQLLQPDGAFGYSELHYTVDLAFHQACAGERAHRCVNRPIVRMWEAWQRRRLSPIHNYTGTDGTVYPLLSMWPSYIVHLPYFSTSSFNSDPTWSALFRSHWAADWAYYNTSAYYGGDGGRYGLAAGFTDPKCSAKGGGYEADMIVNRGSRQDISGAQGCRLFSPYAVAGYLPANPKLVASHLLELLAAGEAVPCRFGCLDANRSDFFMLRGSMLEPQWNINDGVSMVDFASELLGLASYFLPDFFQKYTKHDWSELALNKGPA